MQRRDIKKGISSTFHRASSPSLHRTDSGFRSFPMMREPAPHLRSDADDAQAGSVQRRLTAAGGGDPLVSESPSAMLMPKTGPWMCSHSPESCHGIQYITFPCTVQWEKPSESSLFPSETHFFPTCTSLLYKFCRETGDRDSVNRPFFEKKRKTPCFFFISVYIN